ncbi:hypothetical protein JYU34_021467 [Plutella xylostella]|uniref:Uncharacterized protein n=1 Tax=Plutella xylostella TaxID=51655 RepID=A0ABQ7PV04_PLUXY|nr:hypothetical protein JYU34_021467 [Plutella xylostella]
MCGVKRRVVTYEDEEAEFGRRKSRAEQNIGHDKVVKLCSSVEQRTARAGSGQGGRHAAGAGCVVRDQATCMRPIACPHSLPLAPRPPRANTPVSAISPSVAGHLSR